MCLVKYDLICTTTLMHAGEDLKKNEINGGVRRYLNFTSKTDTTTVLYRHGLVSKWIFPKKSHDLTSIMGGKKAVVVVVIVVEGGM